MAEGKTRRARGAALKRGLLILCLLALCLSAVSCRIQRQQDNWNEHREHSQETSGWDEHNHEHEEMHENIEPPDLHSDWTGHHLPATRSPAHRRKLELSVQLPKGASKSIGKAYEGRLENGVYLPPKGPGWKRFSKDKFAYGTQETVQALVLAFAEVSERYPGTVAVTVGKLSRNRGGPVRPHKSHQSGRDADVGYFVQENGNQKRFRPTKAKSIDAEKTWALLEAMMRYGKVQYVFVDYALQKPLKAAAEDAGWSEEAVTNLFQYPRGKRAKGVFRHSPGHHNHFHIRFACAATDGTCID